MVEFLEVVELGTLYKNGVELPLPTRPWRSDSYPGSLSDKGIGNIPQFTQLQDMSKWNIGDTSSNVANRLKWIKLKDGNKVLLICDRVILNDVSWNNLNDSGYVFGKVIVIDGKKYICRLLIGGKNFRSGTDYYSGGIPIDNEWDKYITNENNINGLPKPSSSDLDKDITYTDLNGNHNKLWNWCSSFSWCQDTYNEDTYRRAIRGSNSSRFFAYSFSNSHHPAYGWRPILEMIDTKKYLLEQNSSYYYINHNYIKMGQPNDNNQLTNWLDKNGYEDISILTKTLNNKKTPVDLENDNINVSWEIDLNDVVDNINLIEEYDRKYIQYNCDNYKVIDEIKKNNDGKFDIVMKEI